MRLVLAAALLAGCAYRPGSFHSDQQSFPGQRSTAGCIDLAVERRSDLHGDVVLAFAFGNRCTRPAIVDLAETIVVGRFADGSQRVLRSRDPRGEIGVRWLDGHAVGREAIAYAADGELVEVCADAGSVARAPIVHWLCFASQPEALEVTRDSRTHDPVVVVAPVPGAIGERR